MSRYFTNYPLIQYQDKRVRDISRRSKVRDSILNDPYIFLPFTIREGEKPEDIARLYYGSVDGTWLVLLANNITDPYYEWPLSDNEFDQYFINKYSEISGRTGFDVIRWAQDETRNDNIVYRFKESESTGRIYRVSAETEGGTAIRLYEYEQQQNENKRNIQLIDKIYRNQVVEGFRGSLRI